MHRRAAAAHHNAAAGSGAAALRDAAQEWAAELLAAAPLDRDALRGSVEAAAQRGGQRYMRLVPSMVDRPAFYAIAMEGFLRAALREALAAREGAAGAAAVLERMWPAASAAALAAGSCQARTKQRFDALVAAALREAEGARRIRNNTREGCWRQRRAGRWTGWP